MSDDMVIARTEVTKKIWEYIKANNLQKPEDRRIIVCDENFRRLFGTDELHMMHLAKHLKSHFI